MGTFDKNFPSANFDIAAFVETHYKVESEFPELIQEYRVFHYCLHTPATHEDKFAGIIILIRKNVLIHDSKILISGRLISLTIELPHEKSLYHISVFMGKIR